MSEGVLETNISEFTLGDVVTKKLLSVPKEPENSEGYDLAYRGCWNSKILKYFGRDARIKDIANEDTVVAFRNDLLTQLQPSTVRAYLDQLAVLFGYAERYGVIDQCPDFPHVPDEFLKARCISADEERHLITSSPDWLRHMVMLALDTGATFANLSILTWDDVDLDREPRGTVKLISQRRRSRAYFVPLSRRSQRILTHLKEIAPSALPQVFVRLVSAHMPLRDLDGNFVGPYQPVERYEPSWSNVTRSARLAGFQFDDLRQSFATRLMMGGVPYSDLKTLMGEGPVRMTEPSSQTTPDQLDIAIEALDYWCQSNLLPR